ncbi:class I SAM-dependent methyltransferase [Candidatus Omnitrophota bacterium]
MSNQYFQTRFTVSPQRERVWKIICAYLQKFIPQQAKILDLGAGYCSLINNVRAAERHALDAFAGFVPFAQAGVETHIGSCVDLGIFGKDYFDIVFASNLLEHLSPEAGVKMLAEISRVLKPNGRLIVIQPNFKYCYREYFDDYTHRQVFTHLSLADLLKASGFIIERSEPRFLPFSFQSRLPKCPWLVGLYLKSPVRPFAKQMLLIAHPGGER